MGFELVMAERDANGKPTGKNVSVSSLKGGDLRHFFEHQMAKRKPKPKKNHSS